MSQRDETGIVNHDAQGFEAQDGGSPMYRIVKARVFGRPLTEADRKLGLPDWLVVQAVTATALVTALLLGGAPVGMALVGAWLMSGLVSLGIIKAVVDLAR